jgi:hypothetical protein
VSLLLYLLPAMISTATILFDIPVVFLIGRNGSD